MREGLLQTTVVGSYVQPEWLVDRAKLKSRKPPRVRAREIWRVSEPWLQDAQDAATIVAMRDMERAGVDIITDGEVRRESYSNRLATALSGIDVDKPAIKVDRTGVQVPVPRIVGPIRRIDPIEVRDVEFLRANTDRKIMITLPGPFTMMQQAVNEFYPDDEQAAMDYAVAVNEEIRDLFKAGADVVQLDEPYIPVHPDNAKQYAVRAINRALEGISGVTSLHMCFGYAHMVKNFSNWERKPAEYPFLAELESTTVDRVSIEAAQPRLDMSVLRHLPTKVITLGVIDLNNPAVETVEVVAARIREALEHVPPERLMIAPDCGMKFIDRSVALGKLSAMVAGARLVRQELGLS